MDLSFVPGMINCQNTIQLLLSLLVKAYQLQVVFYLFTITANNQACLLVKSWVPREAVALREAKYVDWPLRGEACQVLGVLPVVDDHSSVGYSNCELEAHMLRSKSDILS